jgi:hypothetical protein
MRQPPAGRRCTCAGSSVGHAEPGLGRADTVEAGAGEPMIGTTPFGRTGHHSTRVIFGAAALGSMRQDKADSLLDQLFEHGINHIDTAASYGDSELRRLETDGNHIIHVTGLPWLYASVLAYTGELLPDARLDVVGLLPGRALFKIVRPGPVQDRGARSGMLAWAAVSARFQA